MLLHSFLLTALALWVRYGHAATLAARGYRVIMPDLRGHGDSAKPHDPAAYPPDVLAGDGLALVEQLGLTDYDLGGYSLGARTVLRMLARGATPSRAIVAGQNLTAITLTGARPTTVPFRRVLNNLGTFEPDSPEWRTEGWLNMMGGDPVALLHVLNASVATPRESLAGMDLPMLVVIGDRDERRESAKELADLLPNSRYVVIPGDHFGAAISPELGSVMADFLDDRPD